jgi:hypothetical protein
MYFCAMKKFNQAGEPDWEDRPQQTWFVDQYTLAEVTESGNIGERRDFYTITDVIAAVQRAKARFDIQLLDARHPCFPKEINIDGDVEKYVQISHDTEAYRELVQAIPFSEIPPELAQHFRL